MKKSIAIVTYSSAVARFYRQQLLDLLGDLVEIKVFSYDDSSIEYIEADAVLVSTYDIYTACQKYISKNSHIIMINVTLTKDAFDKISRIPGGQKIMLVNLSAEMAMETIALIYQLGINHLELIPVYPGMKSLPPLDVAVTPGEARFVPPYVRETIDIDHRVLDMTTIVDIAVELELDHLLQSPVIRTYFKSIMTKSLGMKNLLGKTSRLEKQFDLLLQITDDGIIGISSRGLVYFINDAAASILGWKREDALGINIKELIPHFPAGNQLENPGLIKGKLINVNGVDLVLSVHPIINPEEHPGVIVTIRRFSDTEKQQHKLRVQAVGKGHIAKYSFDHIIGESRAIKETKEIARRMADSNSSVLIYGESGTGKELFAQAIHNASRRRKYPFIAVNCAALPESLLESELFGYEEGAFTGAKKGGKLGFFEMAHQGSLFLDEISEMAPKLQARLLRAVQEKEVIRIGGDSVIPVDVRVIAATNKNLKEMVRKGEFRRDLYYRLNILPLNIAPLRERPEDIPVLLEHISRELNVQIALTPEAKGALFNHGWEGNVRELRNYLEYMGQLGKPVVDKGDLPFLTEVYPGLGELNDAEGEILVKLKKFADHNRAGTIFVLSELEKAYLNRIRAGRRSIAQIALQNHLFISEQEIRNIFLNLENLGVIEISKGRGGTRLSEIGLKIIRHLKK